MEENKEINIDENLDNNEGKDDNITISEPDLQRMIQQAVKSNADKLKKQYDKELAKQKSLANMDEHQREIAERDAKIAELLEEKRQNAIIREKAEIAKVLSNRGLNANFVDMLSLTDDNTENLKIIDSFDKLFKATVKAEVEKRIPNQNPTTSTIGLEQGMTKEKLSKLDYDQQIAYLTEHPEFIN